MAGSDIGYHIDKEDLQRMLKDNGAKTKKAEEKKPLTPSKIALIAIEIIVAVAYFVLVIMDRFFMEEENFIIQSLDIFSELEEPNTILRMLGLAIVTLTVSKVLRLIIGRLTHNETITKRTGVAVIELLGNLVKYVAIIVLIFLILSAMGVDTAELLAGLGILSLILGLGVTSLVEDVVAGVFIIAERLFDVGDIVVVDDFRGTVLSIGIRSTQIEDEGGDILILRNSQIENLVNMTNRASYAICDIPVPTSESIEKIEEVIGEIDFDAMRESIPEIEAGPFYLGVSEVSAYGSMTLTFVAICQEGSKYRVQRKITRELLVTFTNNEIEIGGGEEEE